MVEFSCTSCGQRLKVPDESAGKAGKCPNCGTTLTIPPPQAAAAPVAPPAAAAAAHPAAPQAAAPAPAARPRAAKPARRPGGKASLALPIAALVVGAAALGLAFWRGPGVPGSSLGSYDFETPEGAVRSAMEIEAKVDIRAMMELQRARALLEAEDEQKKIDTWECGGTVEHDGKIAVMYKYKDEDDDTHYDVAWVEKKDDGLYYKSYRSTPSRDTEAGEKIRNWESKER